MRKWVSSSPTENWNVLNQIVIPVVYQDMILDFAHNSAADPFRCFKHVRLNFAKVKLA